MSFITVYRLITLALILIAALVTLGISAHFLALLSSVSGGVSEGSTIFYPLVVAIIGLLLAPTFIIVGLVRTRAWVTMVVVEYSTLSVLFLLWIVLAALINNAVTLAFPEGCDAIGNAFDSGDAEIQALQGLCREYSGLIAAGFIAAINTLIYLLVLLVFIIIGKTRGNDVWLISVAEADFFKQNIVAASPQYAMNTGSDFKGSNTVLAVPMMNGVPIGPAVQVPSQQMMNTQVTLPQNQMSMGYSMNAQV